MAIDFGGDKGSYLKWLESEVARETATFPKFKKSSKVFLPSSHRRLGTYKRLLDEVFGDSCNICGWGGRLELAHLFYDLDSALPNKHCGSNTLDRMREALLYPERFFRLCKVCHGVFDYARKSGGKEYLKKIEGIIGLAEELEAIDDARGEVQVEGKLQEI
jgi:hypothetical protein